MAQTPACQSVEIPRWGRAGSGGGTLTPRDVELLRLLADGRSTAQIAATLSVSGNTARTKIRRVLSRLAVPDRAAAVDTARALGVLGPLVPSPVRS